MSTPQLPTLREREEEGDDAPKVKPTDSPDKPAGTQALAVSTLAVQQSETQRIHTSLTQTPAPSPRQQGMTAHCQLANTDVYETPAWRPAQTASKHAPHCAVV